MQISLSVTQMPLTCLCYLSQKRADNRLQQALSWLFQKRVQFHSADCLYPSCLFLAAVLYFLQCARQCQKAVKKPDKTSSAADLQAALQSLEPASLGLR